MPVPHVCGAEVDEDHRRIEILAKPSFVSREKGGIEPARIESLRDYIGCQQRGFDRRSDSLACHRIDEATRVPDQQAAVKVVASGSTVRLDDASDRSGAEAKVRAAGMAALQILKELIE